MSYAENGTTGTKSVGSVEDEARQTKVRGKRCKWMQGN